MRKIFYTIFIVTIICTAIPALALTVSPARLEISGDPGVTIEAKIELFNEQEGTRTFYTSFENFEPSGDSGAPQFIGAKDGLATWIQSENKVVVNSGARISVPISITIPSNAEPGGHFAAIFFGSQEPGVRGEEQVSVGGKIGVLVLLRVNGAVTEGGGLLEFITKEKQKFYTELPVIFNYRINNTGGDRVVPLGDIRITNTLGLQSATLLANKNEGSVLPNSARKFEVPWGQDLLTPNNKDSKEEQTGFFSRATAQWREFHFGWYTAKLNLTWGSTNQTATDSYSFFVIPWQLLSIIFLVILITGFVGKIALKKYNRHIIAQAQRIQRSTQDIQ